MSLGGGVRRPSRLRERGVPGRPVPRRIAGQRRERRGRDRRGLRRDEGPGLRRRQGLPCPRRLSERRVHGQQVSGADRHRRRQERDGDGRRLRRRRADERATVQDRRGVRDDIGLRRGPLQRAEEMRGASVRRRDQERRRDGHRLRRLGADSLRDGKGLPRHGRLRQGPLQRRDARVRSPTNSDGIKNGTETDIDCGGGAPTNAPRCDATKKCAAANDCKSGGCNHLGVCAFARSCTMLHGGTTCGTGDATKANQNEDCCASAVVPTYNRDGHNNATEFRLDKYQITAGRIRRFLDAVGGNVKGWVQANRANIIAPNQLPAALDPYLPTGFTQANSADTCTSEGNNYPCNYGALNQVSGFRYNNNPGGDSGYGCYMSPGGYGSRSFFTTPAEDTASAIGESRVNGVSRDRAEEKAMNCVTYYILAAFCAWDGGRLETLAEYDAAYGGTASSGGSTRGTRRRTTRRRPRLVRSASTSWAPRPSAPRNNYGYTPPKNDYSVFNAALTALQKDALLLRIDRANLRWNYFNRVVFDYRAPLLGVVRVPVAAESSVNIANDQSVAVAPPGRTPRARAPTGTAISSATSWRSRRRRDGRCGRHPAVDAQRQLRDLTLRREHDAQQHIRLQSADQVRANRRPLRSSESAATRRVRCRDASPLRAARAGGSRTRGGAGDSKVVARARRRARAAVRSRAGGAPSPRLDGDQRHRAPRHRDGSERGTLGRVNRRAGRRIERRITQA